MMMMMMMMMTNDDDDDDDDELYKIKLSFWHQSFTFNSNKSQT
jgi:hypothetical protein